MKNRNAIFFKKEPYTQEDFILLKKINAQYPYFHRAKICCLKALKERKDSSYNVFLKEVAAATQERRLLFEYVTDLKKTDTKNAAHKNAIGTPLEFSSEDSYSFAQWLELTSYMPVVSENSSKSAVKKHNAQNDLIDTFIAKNPGMPKIDKTASLPQSSQNQNNFDPSSLMTETLARVYVEQKKYEKATSAYKILSLKYPEKSIFFAQKIREIKKLKTK